MTREFQYQVVAYDEVGTITVEYRTEGKPDVLRRIPINPAVAATDLPAFIDNAARLSAPWDIWDTDLDGKAAVIQGLMGTANTATMPTEVPIDPAPAVAAPTRRLSLAEELALWDEDING